MTNFEIFIIDIELNELNVVMVWSGCFPTRPSDDQLHNLIGIGLELDWNSIVIGLELDLTASGGFQLGGKAGFHCEVAAAAERWHCDGRPLPAAPSQ